MPIKAFHSKHYLHIPQRIHYFLLESHALRNLSETFKYSQKEKQRGIAGFSINKELEQVIQFKMKFKPVTVNRVYSPENGYSRTEAHGAPRCSRTPVLTGKAMLKDG